MKITVLGARGKLGRRIVEEALNRGHSVTAVVRDPAQLESLPPAVTAQVADAAKLDQVAAVATGQDVVINATRPAPGADAETVATTRAILEGVATAGTRLLIAGGAAILEVPGTGGRKLLDDPRYLAPAYRAIGEASALQFEVCRSASQVDWAYVCPPAQLAPGERTGRYRRGGQALLIDAEGRSAISMEDFAIALVDEAEQPRHHQTFFTVAS